MNLVKNDWIDVVYIDYNIGANLSVTFAKEYIMLKGRHSALEYGNGFDEDFDENFTLELMHFLS